jgi:serine/threonine protein phosphatase PrpC
MVEDDVIREILSGSGDVAATVDRLIECAKSAGGADNITVVLCQVLPS